MKHSSILAPPSMAMLLAATLSMSAAFGQNSPRDVVASVSPVSNSITYSAQGTTTKPIQPALTNYVAYLVTITNNSGNTLNKVYYVPAITSALGLPTEFVPDSGSPCSQDSTGKVVCSVGQMQAQSPTASFVIFYKSPLAPSPVSGVVPSDTFSLGGTVYFAEGTTDKPDAPNSSYVLSGTDIGVVALGTSNPVLVKSGVRKGGGSIFTGTGGVPTDTNLNAALLSVPALPPVSSASTSTYNFGFSQLNLLSPNAGSARPDDVCPTNSGCLTLFDVTVTDVDPALLGAAATTFQFPTTGVSDPTTQYLQITLRRDASLFKGSINNVQVYYYYSTGWAAIPSCAQVTNPLSDAVPRCVYSRKVFKNSDPEVQANPNLVGDAQIVVLAKSNGRIAW